MIPHVRETQVLGIFHAFGFACGNMAGIRLEKLLVFGRIILRVMSKEHYYKMTETIRQAGEVSKIYRPIITPVTGWRAILKKK